MDTADPSVAPPVDSARLAEAFRIFNQASEELASAYAKLEGQVAALTERMTLLQEALPAGVVVLDAQGRAIEANAAADRLIGRSPVGSSWAEIENQLVTTQTPGEYLADERRLATTVTPLDSAGGRIVLLHDVTENHRLRVQAERNERLAAMGEMAAHLAHQLRTPLAAALLYAGNLENPDLADASRISIAHKTVDRLKHLERLIQDTLMFARGDVLGREAFPVGDLLAELAQTFEPLARARGVEFDIEPAAGIETLTGNRKALVGALTNLLENALQAVDIGGRVTLAARGNGDHMALSVCDNGRGMTPEVAARLFEPFFTTRSDGTGLGLAIARGIARAHGGGIDVRSEPGIGTEFIITLPLSDESCQKA
jgi:two-component system, sensor histidine kinase FlrB